MLLRNPLCSRERPAHVRRIRQRTPSYRRLPRTQRPSGDYFYFIKWLNLVPALRKSRTCFPLVGLHYPSCSFYPLFCREFDFNFILFIWVYCVIRNALKSGVLPFCLLFGAQNHLSVLFLSPSSTLSSGSPVIPHRMFGEEATSS